MLSVFTDCQFVDKHTSRWPFSQFVHPFSASALGYHATPEREHGKKATQRATSRYCVGGDCIYSVDTRLNRFRPTGIYIHISHADNPYANARRHARTPTHTFANQIRWRREKRPKMSAFYWTVIYYEFLLKINNRHPFPRFTLGTWHTLLSVTNKHTMAEPERWRRRRRWSEVSDETVCRIVHNTSYNVHCSMQNGLQRQHNSHTRTSIFVCIRRRTANNMKNKNRTFVCDGMWLMGGELA